MGKTLVAALAEIGRLQAEVAELRNKMLDARTLAMAKFEEHSVQPTAEELETWPWLSDVDIEAPNREGE